MGEPPVPSSLSLYQKLFTPLILPLLAIVLTPLCLFVLNRYLQPAPTPEEEVTRPLIENLEDEEVNSFAQQGKPFLVMSQEDDAHPSSTYGAI